MLEFKWNSSDVSLSCPVSYVHKYIVLIFYSIAFGYRPVLYSNGATSESPSLILCIKKHLFMEINQSLSLSHLAPADIIHYLFIGCQPIPPECQFREDEHSAWFTTECPPHTTEPGILQALNKYLLNEWTSVHNMLRLEKGLNSWQNGTSSSFPFLWL